MRLPCISLVLLACTAHAYRLGGKNTGHFVPNLNSVSYSNVQLCDETVLMKAGNTCDPLMRSANVTSLNPSMDCSKPFREDTFVCLSVGNTTVIEAGAGSNTSNTNATSTSTSNGNGNTCADGYSYVAAAGDSIESLQALFQISAANFDQLNPNVPSSKPLAGTQLCLGSSTQTLASRKQVASTPITPCYQFSKILSAEPKSCIEIAKASNLSLSQLTTLNPGLQCTTLKPMDALCTGGPESHNWAGANSYILHSYNTASRDQTLKDLAAAGIKVIRIFIKRTWAGEKYGSDNLSIDDIENDKTRVYNDTMLAAIDGLMYEASRNGIKLMLCMHDRYNLDATFDLDGYFNEFVAGGTMEGFYSNAVAESAFDARLDHIVTHRNPLMGNRMWKDIPEGLYAFEIQNEAQGEGKTTANVFSNAKWWCDRATNLRKGALKDSMIPIATGGGKDFGTSLRDEFFECDAMDVVTLHSYTGSISEVEAQLSLARDKAQRYKKMVVFEEFGQASNKGGWLKEVGTVANKLHVPFMVWQVLNTATEPAEDFEFYTQNKDAWAALTATAQEALGASVKSSKR
ncbi:glycoside hydrolase superfamily [Chytriomyces cf. hyalinus JEL632]|nr:glycoside hydrolase superfamily [Chytriomyces cf. hyalinus JEL632]